MRRVMLIALLAVPTVVPAQQLDAKARSTVVDQVLERLEKDYVFPEVALKMAAAVRAAVQAGRYDGLSDVRAFGDSLTADLRAVSRDKHLRVVHRTAQERLAGGGPSGLPNTKLVSSEVLADNIGYIRLDRIPVRERLAPELDAAMKQLAGTRALILDLRENPGGSPEGVMYIAGYLIKERTLIARIYTRPTNETTEMWTLPVAGPQYLDKPVYILTSRRTFSAAEATAYHLKHFGRAMIVGDTTGGGAHRINGAELAHGFTMTVPITRPINARTGGDWEGVGVLPDIAVAAERALEAAVAAAKR